MPEGVATAGAGARSLWPLPRELTFLNHGSFGLTPKPVLAVQARLKREMERDPPRFFDHHRLMPRLAEARAAAAEALGASAEDLVFADNATTAVNAVLQSLAFPAGAEVVTTDQVYPAVRNALRHRLDRHARRDAVPLGVGGAGVPPVDGRAGPDGTQPAARRRGRAAAGAVLGH